VKADASAVQQSAGEWPVLSPFALSPACTRRYSNQWC
jgi:hypothetical protein